VNRCAAQNASSFASLAKADTRNFWTSTFLGNDAATLSNLVFGPGRGEAMASALISNPTKYALINPSVGTVFGGMPVGGTIYTASAQTVITPYGPAIDMVPTSKTVADVAGNFVSKAAVAWTAVKAVFDSGAYIKAELKCGGFIK